MQLIIIVILSIKNISSYLFACMHAASLQLCSTLCGSMDCMASESSVHGIVQAKKIGAGCHFLLQKAFICLYKGFIKLSHDLKWSLFTIIVCLSVLMILA